MSIDINLSFFSNSKISTISLPASKSESNRALIINALSGNISKISNLSTARDTVTLKRLLNDDGDVLDVIDAGTTMRFLTSYSCLKKRNIEITGTNRMCERPIGILVEALKDLGAEIEYKNNIGYPPLIVKGFGSNINSKVKIRGDVSSQFISSIAMIAPNFDCGLEIELIGEIGSVPYINMTLQMMRDFGAECFFENKIITISPKKYESVQFFAESDWSGASYWFSIVALSEDLSVELIGLKLNSLQGDSVVVDLMNNFGIKTEFLENKILISRIKGFNQSVNVDIDFKDCPDLAQTFAVLAAAKGVNLRMRGVESLKVKETDRLEALKIELGKMDISVEEIFDKVYEVFGGENLINITQPIETYHDHRMAMSFAPLAILTDIIIKDKEVVAKSYPSFWDDLIKVGFIVK